MTPFDKPTIRPNVSTLQRLHPFPVKTHPWIRLAPRRNLAVPNHRPNRISLFKRLQQRDQAGVLGDILGGSGRREGAAEALAKSAARAIGSQVGRSIIRGVLGSLFGGKR